ncbi:MDR family MFS transporter [Levilactobacillus bambusae]|uniref:MFS transporter n=1 Tax=Levilactobacillus bambusae TaxID=2024736 RepID=A0A2V1N294_9LACO|nr:MDR family MFS transporter [Levilactobacillus bambusae]PWG01092.1 MFS transporter [Levilactobacillus bambusae]
MKQRQTNVLVVTIALFIGTFMCAVEGTVVTTAMPTIVGDLHGVSLMNWVSSIYLLASAVATPIYGKLADTWGRKPIMMAGLIIFTIGSLLSGISTNMEELILWRAVQGIGAGAIMPLAYTIIADIYPFEKRAQVMGLNGSAWGIASIVAPLIGGFIVDRLTWHWVFFINLPIGLITLFMIWAYLNDEWERQSKPLDWQGSLWLSVSLLALMLGFQWLGDVVINWWLFSCMGMIFILAGVCFIRREQRALDPLIPLAMFSNRTFVSQNLVAALVSGFLMGFEFYLPTWTQGLLGYPATVAGFAITPSSLMWIVGSFIAGRLILKWTPKRIVYFSLTFVLTGSLIMAFIPQSTPFGWFFLIAAICGTGFGITITTTTVTVQGQVAPEHLGVATSFNTLSRTLGQTLMISVFGIIMNVSLNQGVSAHHNINMGMLNRLINPQTAVTLPKHLLKTLHRILYLGLHHVFLVAVLLVVAAFVVNSFDRSQPSSER